ncbi:tigger transposable element-derived protein 2-like [Bombus pyrosoma]|uniref:tigger transposable element-derived protein 2-like n=1 Tax=Bombus pyrosoma TaxID=396416 RepID=UPI001CB9A021|nr:tigger transposable element-derived protein 2-like [Bombus pyrosoma]
MTTKRSRSLLIPERKNEILQRIDRGDHYRVRAKKYGIAISTVANIKTRAEELKQSLRINSPAATSSTKHLRKAHSMNLGKVLYQWYKRCKDNNIQITGIQLRKKALELNKKINGDPTFRASHVWMSSFKACNFIDVTESRNFPTPDKAAVDNFKAEFITFLQNEGCTLEHVYNANYTAIMWKAAPEKTLIFHRGKSTSSKKKCEDHITTLFCANATRYTNALMDSTIFNQWFEKHFLKSVKEKQLKNGRREKTLLLLGNVHSRHDLEELNKKDKFVTVKRFPCDVTPLIEPMDHGIITCFKRKYRKELMKTFMPLPIYNKEEEVIELYKELSMWYCCRIVHVAWSYVDDAIMINAWDSLLKHKIMWKGEYTEKRETNVFKTLQLLHSLPGCER